MKRLALALSAFLAACAATLALTACTSISTPAQFEAQVCTPVNIALAVLEAPTSGLSTVAQADVTKAQSLVTAVCNGATTVNVSSIQSIVTTVLPTLINGLQLAGVDTKSPIFADLNLAIAVATAIVEGTVPPAPAPTPVVAASVFKLTPGAPGYVCYTAASGKSPVCK